MSYKDNQPVLDLFLSKPIGLLSLLDEQCRGLNVSLEETPGAGFPGWSGLTLIRFSVTTTKVIDLKCDHLMFGLGFSVK